MTFLGAICDIHVYIIIIKLLYIYNTFVAVMATGTSGCVVHSVDWGTAQA